MSVEEELPHLFEELANDHIVGTPAEFEPRKDKRSHNNHVRSARFTIAAVAACSAVLIGGLVVIVSRNDDQAPVNSATVTPETTQVLPTESSTSIADIAARQSLELIRIEASATIDGTTDVVLVFNGDLPRGNPEPLANVANPPSDRVGYSTQTSDGGPVSVCGDSHFFPPPGNRAVDIFVPSAWFDPGNSIGPTFALDGNVAKIITCEPLNGVVQISVWGSASGRLEDVNVDIDANTIIVDITPATDTNDAPPTANTVASCTNPDGCNWYTVQAGDYPLLVATAFCVTVAELVAANGWNDANEFAAPDDVILIPAEEGGTTCPDPTSS